MGEPTTNDMKIAQVVYNYLGLKTPEAVQDWIVKVTRIMSEGGEVTTVEGSRLIPLSPEVQKLQADVHTLAKALLRHDTQMLGMPLQFNSELGNEVQRIATSPHPTV